MSKNITIAGASYSAVPSILIPLTDGSGVAKFVDADDAGGGLPSGIQAFDFGQITISTQFTTSRQTFNHKLGVVPDMILVWLNGNVAQTYSMLFALKSTQMAYRSGYNQYMGYHGNNSSNVSQTYSNSSTYGISNMTATTFQLASSSSSYYWRAGTYNYIAIKFA